MNGAGVGGDMVDEKRHFETSHFHPHNPSSVTELKNKDKDEVHRSLSSLAEFPCPLWHISSLLILPTFNIKGKLIGILLKYNTRYLACTSLGQQVLLQVVLS